MSIEPINTSPIQQFIQQVKSAEMSKNKEIRMDITQAKNLSYALGQVMSRLHGDLEKLVAENKNTNTSEIIEISMDGGNNWGS